MKKYCLITSSEKRLWNGCDQLIFLDSGCLRYSQKKSVVKKEYKIFKSRFADPAEYKKGQQYLYDLWKRIINDLSSSLNTIHATEYDLKSWKILLGWWLRQYLSCYYYKYIVLCDINKEHDFYIRGFSYEENPLFLLGVDFQNRVINDDLFNTYIATRIGEYLNFEIDYVDLKHDAECKENIVKKKPRLKDRLIELFIRFFEFCSTNNKKIVHYNSIHLYFGSIIKAISKCDVCLKRECSSEPRYGDLIQNQTLRNSIKVDGMDESNDFEAMLKSFIREDIPLVYIEKFRIIRDFSLNYYGKGKTDFWAHDAWFVDEIAKSYLAYARNKFGLVLHGIKHGGSPVFCGDESFFDVEVVDKYYPWGELDSDKCKIIPMPSPKLSSGIYQKKPNLFREDVLFIGVSSPRFVRDFTYPFMVNIGSFLEDEFLLIKRIYENDSHLRCRLYYDCDGWDLNRRLYDLFPNVRCDDEGVSLLESLSSAKICIMDIFLTTWTEVYIRGIPFLICTPEYMEDYNDDVRKDIESLKKCGVYHNSVDGVVKILIDHYDDIDEWWNDSGRKEAVDSFAKKYTMYSERWQDIWIQRLRDDRR